MFDPGAFAERKTELLATLAGVLRYFRFGFAVTFCDELRAALLAEMGRDDCLFLFRAFRRARHLDRIVCLSLRTGHDGVFTSEHVWSFAFRRFCAVSRAHRKDESSSDCNHGHDTNDSFHNVVSFLMRPSLVASVEMSRASPEKPLSAGCKLINIPCGA
ncbi:MAG TPA: hypothetical protein VGF13_05960 [Verrucomicrobiae bacterium]|jgi:hypothetical protein